MDPENLNNLENVVSASLCNPPSHLVPSLNYAGNDGGKIKVRCKNGKVFSINETLSETVECNLETWPNEEDCVESETTCDMETVPK